jgi:hypothetical protein
VLADKGKVGFEFEPREKKAPGAKGSKAKAAPKPKAAA